MSPTMPFSKLALLAILQYIMDKWGYCKARDQVHSADVDGSDIFNHSTPSRTVVYLSTKVRTCIILSIS
jgi:hypothetical protein